MATLSPVTYEDLRWTPRFDGGYTRASRRGGPYKTAITPAIADLDLALPPTVLAEMEDASHEITRFDTELGGEIAPFAAVLLRSESAASSAYREPHRLGAGNRRGGVARRQRKTQRRADRRQYGSDDGRYRLVRHHRRRCHLDHARGADENEPRHTPGQWRGEQVWIGGGNSPLNATFVPPSHTRVPDAIDDLLAFAHRDDLPLLAQIAVGHAQFETIHPFTDGNGRTGRALVQAMLRNKGLTRQVTVPVSAGLLADTDGYIAALTAYRQGDVTPIVERFAEASARATANGRQLVAELRAIRESWNDGLSPAPTRRCGRLQTYSPAAQSSTACSCATNWASRQITHAATSVRSPRPGSSSSSPTRPATVPGAHPRCLPRWTTSRNVPDGEADCRFLGSTSIAIEYAAITR